MTSITNKPYLTLEELLERVTIPPKTIAKWCNNGTWKLNVHFVNPTGRKRFYIWAAIEKWFRGEING